jgi:thiamine biosynthesis lipoprotein
MLASEIKQSNNTLCKRAQKLMGNRFEITVVAGDEDWANESINDAINEIRRIEKTIYNFQRR